VNKELKEYERMAAEIFFTKEQDISPLLKIGMNKNSAKGTMVCYEKLINGKHYSRNIQQNVIIALLEQLFKDKNYGIIPHAIKSLEGNFNIRLEKYGDKKIAARRIVNEYKKKLLTLNNENNLSLSDEISKGIEISLEEGVKKQDAQYIGKKLLEKDMEDLIIKDPQKYLNEPGLELISRQYIIGNYRFDLLFEDRHGAKLIIEIQRGTPDRNHTYKILDYFDEYKKRNPSHFIELVIIANKITRERRDRLESYGITFFEIPESVFIDDPNLLNRKRLFKQIYG